MKIKIIVNGAQGKMGMLACETLKKQAQFELVAELRHKDNLAEAISSTQANVVVDLTRADCVYENTLTIIENNAHPVIGTSGLLDKQIQEFQERCANKNLGGIIVPNFSVAAVLMMHFATQAAQFMLQAEIIERHHPQKLDAPSGTAIKTAELIATQRKNSSCKDEYYKELLPGALGANYQGIKIHSLRLPGILAQQEVVFGNVGETLTLSHNTLDRSCFMPGLLLACEKVMQLKQLYYGLEHLLNL